MKHGYCAKFSVFSLSLVLLSACSTLPYRQPVTPSYSTEIDTTESTLAKFFDSIEAQHPEKTGFHVLYNAPHALETRLQLTNFAEKTLDIQYYIWSNDKVGALVLEAVLRAADRGVKVRILVDDNNSKNLETAYLALAQHPNIQIRVFNPYRFRKWRMLDIILDTKRIERRMHNKTFIVDKKIAIIGGRNLADEYYDIHDKFQFSDMDVALTGKSVSDIQQSFDEYWNHTYAYPITQFAKKSHAKKLSLQQLRQDLAKNWHTLNTDQYLARYLIDNKNSNTPPNQQNKISTHQNTNPQTTITQQINPTPIFQEGFKNSAEKIAQHPITTSASDEQKQHHWLYVYLPLQWVDAKIIKDSADKILAKAKPEQTLRYQLEQFTLPAQHQVDIVSAYFVPDKKALKQYQQLEQNHVNVRIVSNSFAASDVPIVHAFYSKYRKPLLTYGVELYEFLPIINIADIPGFQERIYHEQHSLVDAQHVRTGLHGKFMAIDGLQVFIGSYNFDQRSDLLNTEIGVILNSPELAKKIHQGFDQDILKYNYALSLTPQKRLKWQKQHYQHGKKTYIEHFSKEPSIKWWQKLVYKFIGWIKPLEKQM